MINKKVDEAVFDALLEQAFSDVIEEDFKKIKEESEPCSISSETDHKIRAMIAKAEKQRKPKHTNTILRAAAVVLIVMLNLGLIGILMVPSVNAEVRNVFAELFEKYTAYENNEQDSFIVTTGEYEIGYIPSKFELIYNDDCQILFRESNQGNGYISINISNEDFARTSLDSEYEQIKNVKIHGKDSLLHFSGVDYTLFWHDGYHFITMLSNIDEVELLKIANNIKKIQEVQ